MRRANKMSSEGNKAKRKKAEFRMEWLNTAMECCIIIRDDATGIHKVKNKLLNYPITAHAETLLDHIYVNSEQINVNGGIARLELADHSPTFALIPKTKDKTPKTSPNFFKRDMKCFLLDLFLDDLNLKLNKTSFEDFSVDESFENFLNIFADIVNIHAPLRKCTRKKKIKG